MISIGIIGDGFTNKALSRDLSKNYEVLDFNFKDASFNDELSILQITDICFLCVPDLTEETNYFPLHEIIQTLEFFYYTGVIVINGKIETGTCHQLQKRFMVNLVHLPSRESDDTIRLSGDVKCIDLVSTILSSAYPVNHIAHSDFEETESPYSFKTSQDDYSIFSFYFGKNVPAIFQD